MAGTFSADLGASGRIARMRFVFGGVGSTPLRAYSAEEAMIGERWTTAAVKRAQTVLHKIRQIAAECLGLPLTSIRVMPTRTDKLPNTSATAASAWTDLNGAAVLDACRQIRQRLAQVASGLLGSDPSSIGFQDGLIDKDGAESCSFSIGQLCDQAYRQRIPLFAQKASGKPFHHFAYGAAVSELEIDGCTGDCRLLRADLLQGVGDSLSTPGASTYKLASWSEVPQIFNVNFLERPGDPDVIFGSKALGAPPLMLAISVREAVRDAVAVFGAAGPVDLPERKSGTPSGAVRQ